MNRRYKHLPTYSLGSWLKDNTRGVIGGLKTVAGGALIATGVGIPIGIGLAASGVSDIGAEISGDIKAKKDQEALNEQAMGYDRQQTINQRLSEIESQPQMQFSKGGLMSSYSNGGIFKGDPRIKTTSYTPEQLRMASEGDIVEQRPYYNPDTRELMGYEIYKKGIPGPTYVNISNQDIDDTGKFKYKDKTFFKGTEIPETGFAKGGWIQKAINPAHKGYCTPMTKSTCTPHRKALARRFKSGDLSKKADGGNLDEETRFKPNMTYYANGGTHEQSPTNGIPIGSKGLVEEGEFRYGDYIFSDRI